MSKWTSWIEHTGDESQEWDSEETIKIKLDSGAVVKGWIESLVGLGPFTHYKRLKSNVKAEKKAKEAALQEMSQLGQECDGNQTGQCAELARDLIESGRHDPDTTPLPIITGVGEYRTRGGLKASVDGSQLAISFRYTGSINGEVYHWLETGEINSGVFCINDIIGPWMGPEVEEKPSVGTWANVYKWPSGILEVNGAYPTKQAAKDGTFGSKTNYIGAVLLSHTEGEE